MTELWRLCAVTRSLPPVQLSEDLTRLKEHYEKKMRDLMANTVGTVELQQLKHKHEQKVKEQECVCQPDGQLSISGGALSSLC